MNKATNTLRWIAVPFASVAAFFVAQLLYALFNWLQSVVFVGVALTAGMVQLVNSGVGSWAFIYAGAKTAPNHRFTTGIVLAVIFVLLSGLALAGMLINPDERPLWFNLLSLLIGLVVAIVTILQLKEEE